MYEVIKEKYEISLWDDVLVQEEEQGYKEAVNYNELETYYELVGEKTYSKVSNEEIDFEQGKYYVKKPRKLSYFKEEKIATIGADGHNSPEMVYNPKFVGNISGEHTLTFTISSKYIDKETGETVDNPYMKYLTNERKVKLFYRDEWYDLIIKKIEENKKNFSYTFTANDLFLNELGKNGFKVELNSELENNQGTAEELAAQVLDGTDWIVSSHLDEDEYKSDILVETNLDTLYKAKLNHDIEVVVSAGGWLPIREEDVEPAFTEKDNKDITTISKDEEVYLFYSDLIAKNPNPMVLYRAKNDEGKTTYQVNENEDIIINSYNFRVIQDSGIVYNTDPIPVPEFTDSITLETQFRGYETIRRARTGYDPVTDEFITYFIKKEDESKRKGYVHTEYLSPDLAQNYLANSTDFTDIDAGWVFDGLPQSGKRAGELTSRITEGTEKKAMMLLHLSEKDELYQSQVGSIVKTCLALSQDGETIQTKNEPVQLKDEDEKQKWVNLLKEEYLKFIFPQLFASGKLLKESIENPSEQLAKELELIYSFEYTEEEFTEYVKSALSILNEIIDYSDGDGYLIKFDRFGIKKNRISKKIEHLETSAQEKNNNIESLVSGLSDLLKDVQINTTDLGDIDQILSNAADNIEDTEKKNILNNLLTEVNDVWSFNEKLYATLLDKATGKYIKTENEIFDEAILSLEEPAMEQKITDLVIDLINEIKDIIKEQIDKRFIEHLSVLRYEERRHRALNEGVSGNRTQIERLNKGEKYVFALSLGTYIEDKNKDENEEEESGPTLEDSNLKVTYGFKDEEQFYFSENPVDGVGDYVVATEKFKQVASGEEDGYMTNAPRFIQQDGGEYKYIAYENKKGKYEIQYILKNTVISRPFYEDENGEYVCIEKEGKRQYKLWKDVGSFQKVLNKNDKLVAAWLTSESKVKKYRSANYYEGETFTLSSQFGYGKYKKDLKPSNSQSSEETFSLYSAVDALPELYCFIPDALGDYVHIIFDNPAAVQTKWYEVWTNPDNLNKKYRDFKEGDETITDAIHYFKRYNSNLDYDYHRASLDDGHLGPWKEKYQRYTKHRVSLYGGGSLSSEYSYWFSSPFEDGSECYIPFSYYQIERFDFEEEQPPIENTSLGDVFDYVTFNSEQRVFTTHRNSGGIPVKRTEKTYRAFNTEKDSQRVPLVMKKTEESPKVGVHYVYCNGALANETGYYRLCTKEEVWLYNQWKNKESIDNIGKIFSPWLDISWNPDTPPIDFYVYQEASKDSEEKKWVKEIRNGILRIIPYDRDLHENKTKYYRHLVASEEIPAKEVYFNAGDIYKRVIDEEGKTIGLNYENLRVSFCEYEYDSSIFKIDIKENSEKPILDFDCSKTPKYFDLTHHGLNDNLEPIIIKERYAWWESTVENTYNLIEDLHTKVGMVFKTANNTEQTYPILGAQLFKYKTYKSNNHETLVKFKQQIGENEAYSLTFDEYKKFKKAFQGFFGYDEWNNIEADYGINYLGQLSKGSYSEILDNYTELDKKDSIFMILPGEAPHDSDLVLSNYYIYDPTLEGQDKEETIEYEYIGNDPFNAYDYDYDDECQKVRGIETKEKNYLSALSAISEKFECWIKYELQHHTEEENKNLPMMQYDIAHTPGEIKMIEQTVWINENDETDIIFNPLNVFNSHISNEQNEVISALSQFNPRTYWYDEIKGEFEEVKGSNFDFFEEGVDYYTLTPTGNFKIVDKLTTPVPDGQEVYYIKVEGADEDKIKEYERAPDKNYLKTIQTIPYKKIYLKQFTGNLNYAGFKYGVNLNSIKRTLDSKNLVSKLIVKENTNKLGIDGFCTIQRAAENPIKENFILDFDYYIQHRMLDKKEVWEDLYGKSGYFSQLAEINKNLTDLVNEIAEANECLDRINAKYETYSLARDAAQEEIDNLANLLMDSLKDGVPVPWKFNMDKEVTIMETSWSDEQTKVFETKDKDGNVIDMSEYIISGQERSIEIPKYDEETRKRLIQMDTLQREFAKYYDLAKKEEQNKEQYETKLASLYKTSDEMYVSKENLNKLFFKKYYRFLQEGSWKEDKYFDDTLYYLDALAVSRTSAFPKVTYDIQVIDLQALKDYKAYSFGMGDKTYIEDTEFFGYTSTNKPYQEEVIVTKFEYQLDNPSKNKITVQNYKTQFEDVFKRIAAAVSKVELQTGGYNRGNVTDNAESDLSDLLIGTTTFEDGGLVSTEIGQSTNKIRIANGAIYGTTDGGATYFKIFSAKEGIAPALISNGKLNLENLVLGSADNPSLRLDKIGMTAFLSNGEEVDYSTFVRFDNYGMYGIKNYKRSSPTNDATDATLSDIFVPTDIDSIYENANFGLTWNGFFLNTGDGTGRVSIGTTQDLKMSVKDVNNAWQDRLIIGKLQGNEEEYYGFRVIDDNKNIVLNTDDRGRLYLRHKLYISHFNEETGTITENKEVDGVEVPYTTDTRLDQTNVALGIVKAYKRNEDGGYDAGEELYDNYSSLDYLTKVFSVKSAVDKYDLKNNLNSHKELFKQFTAKQLATLIEPNENLAIFDNGNLYARNAWIEGNIRATGGNILGNLMVGIESPNKTSIVIEGEKGRISAKRLMEDGTYFEPWVISHDGEARFQDAIISGTLSSTVFEYDKIQTVAGAMLIRPGTYAEKVEIVKYDNQEKYIRVTLQTSNNQQTRSDFPIEGSFNIGSEIDLLKTYNSIPPFGNNEEYGFYINYFDFSQSNIEAITFANEEEVIDFERIIKISVDDQPILLKVIVPFTDKYSEENLYEKRIKIKTNSEEIEFSIIRPLDTVVQDNELYLEFFDDYTPSLFMEKLIAPITKEKTIALGINASSTSFLPPESFSIVEIFQENAEVQRSIPHAIFGKLTTEIPELPYNLINSYGLYCDNVILKGSLITSGEGGYTAGVSTRDEKTVLVDDQEEKIVFWAGQQTFTENDGSKIDYDFYVTKSGYLHANKGIFSGVVRAAVLETSTLIGTNSEEGDGAYGLTITSNRSLINSEGSINAILFNSYEGKPYFSLTSLSAEFHIPLLARRQEEGNNLPLFTVINTENQSAIGFFGIEGNDKDAQQYCLNFIEKEESILLRYRDKTVITVNENGAFISGAAKWADNIEIEQVENGCDVYII